MRTLLIRMALAAVTLSGVVVAIMLLRTATFDRSPVPEGDPYAFTFGEQGAPERLAGALRLAGMDILPTLERYLEQVFPRIHEELEREAVSDHVLLYRWPGIDQELDPILLIARLAGGPPDGERAIEGGELPISGAVEGGFVRGRGAVGGSGAALGMLEAVEALLEANFSPRRTVLLALSLGDPGDREGARKTASLLQTRGTRPAWILGEGLYITSGLIPGVRDPVGMIGVGEKAGMNIRLKARAEPGTSWLPPRSSAAGVLASALLRLELDAFPPQIDGPTLEALQTLGSHMDPGTRLLAANLWLLRRPLARALTESPLLNASLRTTVAPMTFLADADGDRLRSHATATAHVRIAPWDSPDSIMAQIRSAVSDLQVEVERLDEIPTASDPYPVSSSQTEGFGVIREAILRVFPDVVAVVPGLTGQDTDSRFYGAVSESLYGFTPFRIDEDALQAIDRPDARVRVSAYLDVVRFYAELIRRGAE